MYNFCVWLGVEKCWSVDKGKLTQKSVAVIFMGRIWGEVFHTFNGSCVWSKTKDQNGERTQERKENDNFSWLVRGHVTVGCELWRVDVHKIWWMSLVWRMASGHS